MVFDVPVPVPVVALLKVHPSRVNDLLEPDVLKVEPFTNVECFSDNFGNNCCRFVARLRTGSIKQFDLDL